MAPFLQLLCLLLLPPEPLSLSPTSLHPKPRQHWVTEGRRSSPTPPRAARRWGVQWGLGGPYHAIGQGAPLLEVAAEALVCGFEAEAADEELAELLRLLRRLRGGGDRGMRGGGHPCPPATETLCPMPPKKLLLGIPLHSPGSREALTPQNAPLGLPRTPTAPGRLWHPQTPPHWTHCALSNLASAPKRPLHPQTPCGASLHSSPRRELITPSPSPPCPQP